MPSYQLPQQNRNIPQASPGLPVYLLGSLNRTVSATRMVITNLALTGNIATLTVNVKEGNLPIVGQLVSITNATPSYLNTTAALAISAVSFNNSPENGIGTIQVSITHADVTSAPADGLAVAPQAEIGETVANGNSLQCAVQSNTGPENGRNVRFDTLVSSGVTAITVDAYTAQVDVDSEYTFLGNVLTTVASTPQQNFTIFADTLANFIRLKISGLAGTGTIIAKVTV